MSTAAHRADGVVVTPSFSTMAALVAAVL